jgi:hypothetical protein
VSDHDKECEFMLSPPEVNRLELCRCQERSLRSRLADVETRMQAQTVLAVSYLNVITEQAGRLAAADALLREGCGYIDDVPDARSAYKDRVRAHLAAAREGEK